MQLVPERAGGDAVRALIEGGGDGWRRGEVQATAVAGRWETVVAGGSRDGSGPLANDDFWSRAGIVSVTDDPRRRQPPRRALAPHHRPHRDPVLGRAAHPAPLHRGGGEPRRAAAPPGGWGRRRTRGHGVQGGARPALRDPDDPSGFVRSDTVGRLRRRACRRARALGRPPPRGGRGVAGGPRDRRLELRRARSPAGARRRGRCSCRTAGRRPGGSRVLAGVRWDSASPWGSELSPRVSVSWEGRVARSWVSFGRAFRAPGLGELYYPFSGNPDLAPERSRSVEVGVAAPLAAGRSVLQLVAFSNRQRDLIDFDFASFRYVNVARAREDGVEASWIAMVGAQGRATAALTWLDARDGAGAPLLRRPAWSGSVTLVGAARGRRRRRRLAGLGGPAHGPGSGHVRPRAAGGVRDRRPRRDGAADRRGSPRGCGSRTWRTAATRRCAATRPRAAA